MVLTSVDSVSVAVNTSPGCSPSRSRPGYAGPQDLSTRTALKLPFFGAVLTPSARWSRQGPLIGGLLLFIVCSAAGALFHAQALLPPGRSLRVLEPASSAAVEALPLLLESNSSSPRDPPPRTEDQVLTELGQLVARLSSLEQRLTSVDVALQARSSSSSSSSGGTQPSAQANHSVGGQLPGEPKREQRGGSQAAQGPAESSVLQRAGAVLAAHLEEVGRHPDTEGLHRIPKMIHQVYGLFAGKQPPWYLALSLDTFKRLNPGWTHLLWGPADVEAFVAQHHPALWPAYQRLALPVLKADLVRYLLMLTFGGVYADIDTRCLQPIESWADGAANVSLIVGIEVDAANIPDWSKHWGRQLQISQWAFAAAPQHPVMASTVYKIMRLLSRRVVEEVGLSEVTHVTGPSVFTDAVYDYLRTQVSGAGGHRQAGAPWSR
ncbi:nucleotide-diphospho-sugar transferase [Haematococcus lacustris]